MTNEKKINQISSMKNCFSDTFFTQVFHFVKEDSHVSLIRKKLKNYKDFGEENHNKVLKYFYDRFHRMYMSLFKF